MPQDSPKLLDEIRACIALIEAEEVQRESLRRQRIAMQSMVDVFAMLIALVVCGQQIPDLNRFARNNEQHSVSASVSFCLFFASWVVAAVFLIDLASCHMRLVGGDIIPLTICALKSDDDRVRMSELQQRLGLTPTSNLLFLKTSLKEAESALISKLTFLSGQNKKNQGSALFGFFAHGEGAAIDVIRHHIFPELKGSFST